MQGKSSVNSVDKFVAMVTLGAKFALFKGSTMITTWDAKVDQLTSVGGMSPEDGFASTDSKLDPAEFRVGTTGEPVI